MNELLAAMKPTEKIIAQIKPKIDALGQSVSVRVSIFEISKDSKTVEMFLTSLFSEQGMHR